MITLKNYFFQKSLRLISLVQRKMETRSYLECCDKAINADDLIFFIEDDYLFENNCIDEMIFTYSRLSTILDKEIIMCPSDYPFYYDSL